ncbi:MAG TPA: cupin domain-containing protein [Thermomicrobiales bacterium]|nr:cupin domain-containing protein [Thermomicrobiales bacterium]
MSALVPPAPEAGRRRFDASQGPRIVGPADGLVVDLGSVGVRFLVWGEESGGGFSLVEHPIPPRTLAAPLHRHANEDEYSYVLEGRLGALLGEDVVFAEVGDLVFKPRQQWHTFWNAGDGPCRILEIISPGGFEQVFAEMASDPESMSGDSDAAEAMDRRYGIEADYESIDRLCAEHGLVFPA